jgi:hypothetical protein
MKIKTKLFVLVVQVGKKLLEEIIPNFKLQISIFFLILPILILAVFFILFEARLSNLFFMIIFLLNYYMVIFILILVFAKSFRVKKARSPFYFIKRLNKTGNRTYWDEHKQSLRHLIGAEIGVDKGENAERILSLLNIKQLVLVDPWKEYVDVITGISTRDSSCFQNLYEEVKNKFSNNSKVRIVRDYSVNAAKMFDNEYFDFVYLDGDHAYEEVLKDLEAWYPKLKKFGVMCGDDYGHPSGLGVIKAVYEFAYKHKVIVNYETDNQFFFVKV